MEELLRLYHGLLREILPSWKRLESALNDDSLCMKSKLMTARIILYESSEEFQSKIDEYYRHNIFEKIDKKELTNTCEKLQLNTVDLNGIIFLN